MKIKVSATDWENLTKYADKEKTGRTLIGIYVCKRNGLLNMVATNGWQLMVLERELESDEQLEDNESIIIPQTNFAKKAITLWLETEKTETCPAIKFTKVDKNGQSQLTLPNIEGKYPEYTRAFPKEEDTNRPNIYAPINPECLVLAEKVLGKEIYHIPYCDGEHKARMWVSDTGRIKYYVVVMPIRV